MPVFADPRQTLPHLQSRARCTAMSTFCLVSRWYNCPARQRRSRVLRRQIMIIRWQRKELWRRRTSPACGPRYSVSRKHELLLLLADSWIFATTMTPWACYVHGFPRNPRNRSICPSFLRPSQIGLRFPRFLARELIERTFREVDEYRVDIEEIGCMPISSRKSRSDALSKGGWL